MANRRTHSDGRAFQGELPGKAGAPRRTRTSLEAAPRKRLPSAPPDPQSELHARLKTAEETLRAIQSGEVDALMVSSSRGERVVSLQGGEPAYRMLVEAMSEGAATLSRDGAVLYSNRRFAEMMRRQPGKMIGIRMQPLIAETERERFEKLLTDARKAIVKGEFNLLCPDGSLVPVYLSLSRLRRYKGQALGMVITDLSEQKRQQAAKIKQAETTQRLLLERTISAQEEERRRIARELHDEAGQLLTALLAGLRTLDSARKLADVKVQGYRLREITVQAIDEVGRIARGLHPTVLDDHGLGVALSRYAADYTKTYNIAVDLALDEIDSGKLPFAVQFALYRILQEAMTNAARHSGARTVSIQFALRAAAVEVTVIDDGCGFDAKTVAVSSQRLGIQSMRERAAMLGGTVSFIPQPKGTSILVQLPLARQGVQRFVGRRNS
jgi:PAS domain S-box-containing protein